MPMCRSKTIRAVALLLGCFAIVPSFGSLSPAGDFCVRLDEVQLMANRRMLRHDSFHEDEEEAEDNTKHNNHRRSLRNVVTCKGDDIDLTNIANQFEYTLQTTRLRLQKSSGYCTDLSSKGEPTPNVHTMKSITVNCFSVVGAIGFGQTVEVCVGWCIAPSTRRKLQEHQAVAVLAENKEDEHHHEYRQFSEKCADYEYHGHLVVDDHIMVVGVPSEPARAAGCPHVAAHAVYDENPNVVYRKEVFVWRDPALAEQILEDSLHVGTFSASHLVRAHENVDPTQRAASGYDIITNNCANYALDLAAELDVKVDAAMVRFVSRRLIEKAGQDFIQKIRSSANFFSLFPSSGRSLREQDEERRQISDEEVVQALVATRAVQAGVF